MTLGMPYVPPHPSSTHAELPLVQLAPHRKRILSKRERFHQILKIPVNIRANHLVFISINEKKCGYK